MFKKRCGGQVIEFVIAACVIIVVIFVCLNIFDTNLSSVFKADDGSSRLANLFGNSSSRTSQDSLTDPSKTFQANSDIQSAINESTKTTGAKSQLSFYNDTMNSLINKTAGLLGDGSDSANALKQYLQSTSSLAELNGTNATQDAINKAQLLEKAIDTNKKGADAAALQAALDAYMKDHPNDITVKNNINNIMAMGTALDYSVDPNFDAELDTYLTNNAAVKNTLIAAQIDKIQKDLNANNAPAPNASFQGFLDNFNNLWDNLYNYINPSYKGDRAYLAETAIPDSFKGLFSGIPSGAITPANAINNIELCIKNNQCGTNTNTANFTGLVSYDGLYGYKNKYDNAHQSISVDMLNTLVGYINSVPKDFIAWLNAKTTDDRSQQAGNLSALITKIVSIRPEDDEFTSYFLGTYCDSSWVTYNSTLSPNLTTSAYTDTSSTNSEYVSNQLTLLQAQAASSNNKVLQKDVQMLANLMNGDSSAINTKDKISMIISNKDVNKSFTSSQAGQDLLSKINVYFVNNYNEIMDSTK